MQKVSNNVFKGPETGQSTFALIEGIFSAEEAVKVLFPLINSKISFHQLESFGREIRTGKTPAHSEQRIKALIKIREDIKMLTDYARERGLILKINSHINISLEKPESSVEQSL